MTQIVFFGGMLVLFWLLIVQPQRRRRQKQVDLLAQLAVGDEVMTSGGLFGSVREVADDHVMIEIAPETRVRVAKSAVATRVEPALKPAEPSETSLP